MSVATCPYPLADGAIEEWAWVPVSMAASAEEAVEAIARSEWEEAVEVLHDDGMKLVATGERSWHRKSACLACDGSGADEVWWAAIAWPAPTPRPEGPALPCGSCSGTGEQPEDDVIAWEACKPDDPGAVEFWNLEVVEASTQGTRLRMKRAVFHSVWIILGAAAAQYPTGLVLGHLDGVSGLEELLAEFCAALLGAHLFSVALAVWTMEAQEVPRR